MDAIECGRTLALLVAIVALAWAVTLAVSQLERYWGR